MIKRYTMLNYIPKKLDVETKVNPARVCGKLHDKKSLVACIISRSFRREDNIIFSYLNEQNITNYKLIFFKPQFEISKKQAFFDRNFSAFIKKFSDYYIFYSKSEILKFLKKNNIKNVITDFNPLFKIGLSSVELDTFNILPARFISNHKEYNAQTLRRKIYMNIADFLTDLDNYEYTEAIGCLNDFLKNKLYRYAEDRNRYYVTSGLSKYLNWGFISPQRIALEVLKSNVDDMNKEAFLEELIVRRELSSNFCLYAKNYRSYADIPSWAYSSIKSHSNDLRVYNYSLKEFEEAKTANPIWNKIQTKLIEDGIIHPYLRMFWAKKIMEWTASYESALEIAIYLNDKYAYDAPSCNGYTGILWALGGLHDRPFRDMPVTGKVRRMSEKNVKNMI